jgi:hypothetical protein
MKYIKKFNEELNKSTYLSAANKLREMGGKNKIQRAEDLENHAKNHGDEYDIHNLHWHEFTINGNSGYLINGDEDASYKVRRERSRCYLTVFMYDTRRDKKSITIEFTYYGENGWACNYGQHEKVECISDGMLEMWLNYYDGKGKYIDNESDFLFENRKDAVEFKNFIIDFLKNDPKYSEFTEEMEALSKISVNQMID